MGGPKIAGDVVGVDEPPETAAGVAELTGAMGAVAVDAAGDSAGAVPAVEPAAGGVAADEAGAGAAAGAKAIISPRPHFSAEAL